MMIRHLIKILVFLALLIASPAWALTPIARVDVVPYQMVAAGETFAFGVIAFSKSGITAGGGGGVSCVIADGTANYTGISPLTATSMILNTRVAHSTTDGPNGHTGWPGVYEYVITIDGDDFAAGDGTFTVTCTVTDDDSNSRELPAVTMFADTGAERTNDTAYVDGVGGSPALDDPNNPYDTIANALSALETANSGDSSHCTIYLEAGTYDITGLNPTAASGWLTIEAKTGEGRDNVIINGGSPYADSAHTKFSGLTFTSSGKANWVVSDSDAGNIWIHNCKITNSDGRYISAGKTDPNAYTVSGAEYVTDTYMYDIDKAATSGASIVRNCTVYKVAGDASRNSELVVNLRIDDQDNGTRTGYDGDADLAWGGEQSPTQGTHTGDNNEATVMTDSAASFTVDLYIDNKITNLTDGSSCTITDNDETTVTCAALTGGTDNDWDTGDSYMIGRAPYHSDAYQLFTDNFDNMILYNIYGTDLHHQGLFMRNGTSTSNDTAVVNVFMEMREPGNRGDTDSDVTLTAGAIYCDVDWDHLLVWHSSFPYQAFSVPGTAAHIYTNSSFIGNVFWEFRVAYEEWETGKTYRIGDYVSDGTDYECKLQHMSGSDDDQPGVGANWSTYWTSAPDPNYLSIDPAFTRNANPHGNEFLYNHYKASYRDGHRGDTHIYAFSPDSGATSTQSIGDASKPEVLDLTDTTNYSEFGIPLVGSGLRDYLPSNLTGIPADALGNLRDATPDIGAFESTGSESTCTGICGGGGEGWSMQ